MNNINNLIPFQRILIPEEVTHADWSKIVESIKTVSIALLAYETENYLIFLDKKYNEFINQLTNNMDLSVDLVNHISTITYVISYVESLIGSATTEQKELLNQSIDDLIYVHSIIKNSVPNEYTN